MYSYVNSYNCGSSRQNGNNSNNRYCKTCTSTEPQSAPETSDDSSNVSNWVTYGHQNYEKNVTENNLYSAGQRYQRKTDDARALSFIAVDNTLSGLEIDRCADKTTYCRPVVNLYNQEYVLKTMEKKQRLRFLVKNIIESRNKEKRKHAWSNYIRDLKIKHGVVDDNSTRPTSSTLPFVIYTDNNAAKLENDHNTRFTPIQPDNCKDLLGNLYHHNSLKANRIIYHKNISINNKNKQINLPLLFEPNPYYCYPSSSQGRFLKQNASSSCALGHPNIRSFCEKSCADINQINIGRLPSFRGNRITVLSKAQKKNTPRKYNNNKWKGYEKSPNKKKQRNKITSETQTEKNINDRLEEPIDKHSSAVNTEARNPFYLAPETSRVADDFNSAHVRDGPSSDRTEMNTQKEEQIMTEVNKKPERPKVADSRRTSIKEEYAKISDNVARLKEKNDSQKCFVDQNLLESIENKLDLLIIAINSLLVDSKTSYRPPSTFSSCNLSECISKKPITDNNSHRKGSKNTNYRCNMSDCTSVRCIKRKKLAEVDDMQQDNFNYTKGSSYQQQKPKRDIQEPRPHRSTDLQFVNKIFLNYTKLKSVLEDKEATKKGQDPRRLKNTSSSIFNLGKGKKIWQTTSNHEENNVTHIIETHTSETKKDKSNSTRSENNGPQNSSDDDDEKYFCGVIVDDTQSPFGDAYKNDLSSSKIDRIFIEEMDKSDQAKRDINDILNGKSSHPRGVQISIDVPTRENCTEVTDSLSRTKLAGEILEEFQSRSQYPARAITIAVNTDPLSLMALLRISTDTIRQLLSYMQFNYQAYLPMLSQPLTNAIVSRQERFVCHICGATFMRVTQLSEHIQNHDTMAVSRDCCVCRHLLELRRNRSPGLFTCQFCGQCFTRAYCCELHEQNCARQSGQTTDIPENLAILR